MKIVIRYKTADGILHESRSKENEDYLLVCTKNDRETRVVILPKHPIRLKSAVISMPYPYPEGSRIFVNGYQSWTNTREFELDEEIPNTLERLPDLLVDRFHFTSYGDYWFKKTCKGELHGFTFGYIRDKEGNADVFGSLNEENAWLILRYNKNRNRLYLESDCADRRIDKAFDLFHYIQIRGPIREAIHEYFDLFGTCDVPTIRGYTSWYLDYQNITEEKMTKTLQAVDSDHFDLFQIDDGYETFVGDWLEIDPEKFPNGLSGIVKEIHRKGLKAGIWLAPFVCETKSRVFREHPDWVYRKSNGEPVFAGSNWSGFCPLDIRKTEVRNYIKSCLKFYKDAGFDFFKLDFLYAAAMIRSSGHTRAEIMRRAMIFLRKELKYKLILGCGVLLSSAFNLVDYCRIGPDVSLAFDDVPYMRIMHRERVSTKNTIQNTIFRHCMDGTVFRCDPDVFLLRDDNISLSREQKEALVMINHLCGAVFLTSDDVGKYDEEKKELLLKAQALQNAAVCDIKKTGPVINILYEQEGQSKVLLYHTGKGILLNG